jgi:hypothetical protein
MNQKFADVFWQTIIGQPLGSLTKRKLELIILDCTVKTSVLDRQPHIVTKIFQISMAKAHAYLNDNAIRESDLSDDEALKTLNSILISVEITNEVNYLILSLNNASFRIWHESKMSDLELNSCESIRRDLVKISPFSLLKLLNGSDRIVSPSESLKMLKAKYGNVEWYKQAINNWKKETTWEKVLNEVSVNLVSN